MTALTPRQPLGLLSNFTNASVQSLPASASRCGISVGAASSVAVAMATRAGMALYSFVRPGRGNLYV